MEQYQISEEGLITIPVRDFVHLVGRSVANDLSEPTDLNKNDSLYSESKAKEYLSCSTATLYYLLAEDKITSIKAGKNTFYLKSSLDRYLTSEKEDSNG